MKETQALRKEPTEFVAQKQIKKQEKYLGRERKIPGLTLWEYNGSTNVLKKAEIKTSAMFNGTVKNSVSINSSCAYMQALNRKNAIKKVKQRFGITPQ